MNFYKNKHFVKRNYDCTNIVACQANESPNDNYELADESVTKGLTSLYVENGVRYYGYL